MFLSRQRTRILLRAAVFVCWAISVTSLAQEPPRAATANVAKEVQEVTAETILAVRKQVDSDAGLDEATRERLIGLCERATEQLRLASEQISKNAELKQLVTEAPALVVELQKQLATSPPDAVADIPSDATVEQLEQFLAKAREEFVAAQAALEKIDAEPKRRADRRTAVPQLIVEANRRLAEVAKATEAPAAPGESTLETVIGRTVQQATKQAVEAELATLQSELSAYDATVELLTLEGD